MKHCLTLFICSLSCFVLLFSCAHARPPKPGPNFVWVAPHETPNGGIIHGHWKYTGPDHTHKVWVPTHKNHCGNWIPGHWKPIKAANPKAVWIPGHLGPGGKWIPGHWK